MSTCLGNTNPIAVHCDNRDRSDHEWLTLTELARELRRRGIIRRGRRTFWVWASKGVLNSAGDRVLLEHRKASGIMVSNVAMFRQFLDRSSL